MEQRQILNHFLKIVFISFLMILIFRLYETYSVVSFFDKHPCLICNELLGFFADIMLASSISLLVFPVFLFIYKYLPLAAIWLSYLVIGVLGLSHFIILKYFLSQSILLDIFVFQYSIREIVFTIGTSGQNHIRSFFILSVLVTILYLAYNFLKKIELSKTVFYGWLIICILSIPANYLIHNKKANNKFIENKSAYFYQKSIKYLFSKKRKQSKLEDKYVVSYQELFPAKNFVTQEYPLLHHPDTINNLGLYFEAFETKPNIVILIVEGLNDDFIHKSVKGVCLMPFLDSLKRESLYWNKCFTLGERSFAVVPSLLGSLPYGDTGFTLLDKIPRHTSIVSILKSNNYHTSFFFNQGSWFHKMDCFFKFNHIDLIFDNSSFSEKYSKIIMSNNNFFWGFHDKDFFAQAIEVIDTLPEQPRLEIYFTGTCHAPFVISDEDIYNQKFSKIINRLRNSDDKNFFINHKKFVECVLFDNDALKFFFDQYKLKASYNNTIFIITGDHPMSEIPPQNSLKRFHVPLLIFSPKLKKNKSFNNPVSHLDFLPTILNFLKEYGMKIPDYSTAIGENLFITETTDSKIIPFMNDNREIVEIYSNNYYLSRDKLFSVDSNLIISPIDDKKIIDKLSTALESFIKISRFTSLQDKIISDSLYCKHLSMNTIYQYQSSRSVIFNKEYSNLTNSIRTENTDLYLDITFDFATAPDENIVLVYQLNDANDINIYWGGVNVKKESKTMQLYTKIPKQNTSDSVVYFKSFIWNKTKKDFEYSNFKILLYTKTNY